MAKPFIEWLSFASIAAVATAAGRPHASLLFLTVAVAVALAVIAMIRMGWRSMGRSARTAEGAVAGRATAARELTPVATAPSVPPPVVAPPFAAPPRPSLRATVAAELDAGRPPADPESPELTLGRIRTSMDDVLYTPGAPNVLSMTKYRGGAVDDPVAPVAPPAGTGAEVAPAQWTWLQEGDHTVIRIRGTLDAIAAPQLKAALDALVAQAPGSVVIDLSALRIIDSTGVGAVVGLFKRFSANGSAVRLVGLKGQPLAVFQLFRLDRLFPLQ